MAQTVDQPNINLKHPVRIKPGKAKGRCPACNKKVSLDLRVRGNQGHKISGEFFVACENSKCETKPNVRLTYDIKL